MYDKLNGDRGILNDYDLAHIKGESRPSGTERTGTMPFMALDLLTNDAWGGKLERLYRHDCESFGWVLLWICCRYDNGKEIKNAPLGEFITHDYNQCFEKKRTIFPRIYKIPPTPSYIQYWDAAIELLTWPFELRSNQEIRRALGELSTDEVVGKYSAALESKGFSIALC